MVIPLFLDSWTAFSTLEVRSFRTLGVMPVGQQPGPQSSQG